MNFDLVLSIGSLVRTISSTKHRGALGIVVETRPRWIDPYEEELLVTVLYPDTGEELSWSDRDLEVVQ